jgi:hypothetical protein
VQKHETPRKPRSILVVGDWLVDEHWVLGVHRSKTSSRTGDAHYRTLQNPDSTVISFCGAGLTAAILHRARSTEGDPFGITGLGVWNENDQPALEAMLDSTCARGLTPHQMSFSYQGNSKKRQLLNLVRQNNAQLAPSHRPGTTRVIRLYRQTGQQVHLTERIDWEVKKPDQGWVTAQDLSSHEALKRLLNQTKIEAVVVKDLLKGAVSPDLVEFIGRHLREEVPWFVSSKEYSPSWISKIDPERIHLLEIPQAAARDAIEKQQLETWLTRSGDPSQSALTLLDDLAKHYPNGLIIAVPTEQSVIAHREQPSQTGGEKQGVFWTTGQTNPFSIGLPMASVCFAAFTAFLLERPKLELAELVDASLSFTEIWRGFEGRMITDPLSWDPAGEPHLEINHKKLDADSCPCPAFSWTTALNHWNAAYTDCGVIDDGSKKRIDIRRAMTEVKNYVCTASSKRAVLRQIIREVEIFKRGTGTRSCMIVAPPGSGKSLLAQLIAEDHGLYFLEFNITQMISKIDILDCFDVILTTQYENRGKQLLVFVDEVDGHLQNESVYDAFLGPLERGVYRRAGKTFPLEPCFWLFADTKHPTASKTTKKASDFVSRLTLKPLEMSIGPNDDSELENVYLGVALVRAEFPDVREVSTHVLEAFRQLNKGISIRDIRQFVASFMDVKMSEVRWENLPKQWAGTQFAKRSGPEQMVEITGQVVGPDILARFSTAPVKRIAAKAGS